MNVSIVIINYNTSALTIKCIESLYQYNNGFEYEIILVDNASVECDANLFKEKFPDIKLIKSKENLGFAGGNNLGIEHTIGEYILLLNSDTELIENSIKTSLDFYKSQNNIGALSCKLIFPDGKYQSVAQRFPSIKYKLIELFRVQKFMSKENAGKLLLGAFFDHNVTVEVDWVWGAFFMFKKSLLNKLPNNKLNDEYFMYWEDVQWCYDFVQLGYKNYYLATTKVIHKMGGSSGKKNELMDKNGKLFMQKNFNPFKIDCIKNIDRLLIK